MSRILLIVFVFMSNVTVRADDVPEALKVLTGRWSRSFSSPIVFAKDGVNVVCPELGFHTEGKKRSLLVSGSPPTVYYNPLPPSYDLVVVEGAEKGLLAIIVKDPRGELKIHFTYTLEKDTLTITCKEKVPAGIWLGDYDISGTWVRFKGTYK